MEKMSKEISPFDLALIEEYKPLVLVIDDDSELCDELECFLKKQSYRVVSTGNIKTARKILTENYIDIILLDLKLPDGNGIDLVKNIKEQGKDTCVIIITAYGSLHSAIKAIKERIYDYITKPFDPEKILKIVNSAAIEQIKERKRKKDLEMNTSYIKRKFLAGYQD